MKIKGAVLREVNQPYSIEELELEPPKENEALVRYVYTGYCHSDLSNLLVNVQMACPLWRDTKRLVLWRKSGRVVPRSKKAIMYRYLDGPLW